MFKATVRAGGGGEASLNIFYLIQEASKNVKNGVPLFEILHTGAIFSLTGFVGVFYLFTGRNTQLTLKPLSLVPTN